jgi:hypothetical protein
MQELDHGVLVGMWKTWPRPNSVADCASAPEKRQFHFIVMDG